MSRSLVLIALVAAQLKRYVIVSSPAQSQVLYWEAPPFEKDVDVGQAQAVEAANGGAMMDPSVNPQTLISGLKGPIGLAVDMPRHGLYVADPEAMKIYRYVLIPTATGLEVGDQMEVVSNKAARWIAVDAIGSLFFTDEGNNVIYKVPATQLVKDADMSFMTSGAAVGSYTSDLSTPISLYDGTSVSAVSAPGGVAVDNFRVFWSNKVFGTQVGSVVQGYETPSAANPTAVTPVALNAIKVYGVCLSSSNVYFTDDKTFMYGVKKVGGAIATISEKMLGPRGCSWDGDGTVYVADETGNQVWSFPANMKSLSPQRLDKAFQVQGPSGVAVFTTGSGARAALLALLAYLSA